jgi:superfamily II DNA or RNA helicase
VVEPVFATVAGNLILHDLPAAPLDRLQIRLRVKNEKHVRAIRMNRRTTEPEWIEAITHMPDGSAHVPRGSIDFVKEQFAKCGHELKIRADQRSKGLPLGLVVNGFNARDYQTEGVEKLLRHLQGLIVLPCGCGKTLLGVHAISRIDATTLIIVHTTDLADQWEKEIIKVLGVKPGVIGAGRCEASSSIVIGVDDSLVPYLEANPEYGKRYGFVIDDEAHHTPSKTFLRALALLPAKYRLGLTATPDREDRQTDIMDWSFGPRLLERGTQEMIKLGFLMNAEVEEVETGWRFEWDGDANDPKKIAEMEKALATDLSRNAGIADRIAAEAKRGEIVLVLANRKEMVKELEEMILARVYTNGITVKGVTSSTGKKKRKEWIEAFRNGLVQVLIATSLADEGLDVPRLSRVALAFPQKAKGATTQRLGRLLRLFQKKPKLIDFIDSLVPTLDTRAQHRRRVWKSSLLL